MGTLYINEQYSVIKQEGEALVVDIPADAAQGRERRKVRVPLITVDHVVVFGEITLTASAVGTLLERRVPIHYLTKHGRSHGCLLPDPSKNAALRVAQHQAFNDAGRRFGFARLFVAGKLRNLRTVLLRYERKHADGRAADAARRIKDALHGLARLAPPEQVRPDDRMHGLGSLFGCEGQGSSAYFDAFGGLLAAPWSFNGCVRRPPRDPVNALLSFGYVILASQVTAAINIVGLDPYVGLLHSPGFGKPALALDLMEEFRPLVVDPVVVTGLNTSLFRPTDFQTDVGGSVRLTDEARKQFLHKLEERLNSTIQHPYFGYQTTYRRCIELQARLLAKALLGEIPHYQPFIVR
jgi:CRISPR-associated protein Cas1